MHNPKVKNLIFDLGGVILDLSVPHTLQAFSRLSGIPEEKVKHIFVSEPGFEDYESGAFDDNEFRNFIRRIYNVKANDTQIDECWNAMLRDIPRKRLDLLDRLRETHNVFLLSNTNNIHLQYFNNVLLKGKGGDLDSFFHRAYYSHRMLKRKPNPQIFTQVLDENNLNPAETLFLDDNALNIKSAASVGLHTVLVTFPDQIFDVFR